jgi:hypothetical protein
MSAFHTGIHQRYVMKVDPAAASLRGQHTEQNTITEYMIFEFTAYTVTLSDGRHKFMALCYVCGKARESLPRHAIT